MTTFSALLALYGGTPPVTGGFPSQRPVTRSFGVFFDVRLNKWVSILKTLVIWDAMALIVMCWCDILHTGLSTSTVHPHRRVFIHRTRRKKMPNIITIMRSMSYVIWGHCDTRISSETHATEISQNCICPLDFYQLSSPFENKMCQLGHCQIVQDAGDTADDYSWEHVLFERASIERRLFLELNNYELTYLRILRKRWNLSFIIFDNLFNDKF